MNFGYSIHAQETQSLESMTLQFEKNVIKQLGLEAHDRDIQVNVRKYLAMSLGGGEAMEVEDYCVSLMSSKHEISEDEARKKLWTLQELYSALKSMSDAETRSKLCKLQERYVALKKQYR